MKDRDRYESWIPNHSVIGMNDEVISADAMCLVFHDMLTENFSPEDVKHMNDLFVSSLLANGWITYLMLMSSYDEEDI